MKICVFGMGYVGVVVSACLAKLGHYVIGVDIVERKVDMLRSGLSPIKESGIGPLVKEAVEKGFLNATMSVPNSLTDMDAIMVCVGTPPYPNGEPNLASILKVTNEIANHLRGQPKQPIIIFRSTIPPGTMENIILPIFIDKTNPKEELTLCLLYHPEFLREGSAISDFFETPQMIVAKVNGLLNQSAIREFFTKLYKGINYDLQIVNVRIAEMIKYVNNAFHALKVSFANEVGRICSKYGVDTKELFELFIKDRKLNISSAYLRPGFAFGGSCLPKDLRALVKIAERSDLYTPLISAIESSNEAHIEHAFQIILNSGCRRIGFLGLSFKPNTDDVRESPFLKLIEKCIGKGMKVRIFDQSINVDNLMGKNLAYLNEHLEHIAERLVISIDKAIRFAELVVLCHSDKLYIDVVNRRDGKNVLDLAGIFDESDLSEFRNSIFVSRNNFKNLGIRLP